MTLHYHGSSDTTIAAAKYKALRAIQHDDPHGLTQLELAFYHANHPQTKTSSIAKSIRTMSVRMQRPRRKTTSQI